MRRLIIKLLHTVTGRITAHVTVFSIVSVLVIFIGFLHMEKRKLADGAARYTLAEMDAMANHVEDELRSVQIDVDNYTWMLASNADTPDSIYQGMRHIIESNENINACTVAFSPSYYISKGRGCALYAYRSGEGIGYSEPYGENHEYEYLNWYIVPVLTKTPYWDDPSLDHSKYTEEETDSDDVTVTYSKPLYDDMGKMYAVVAVEVNLRGMLKVVADMKLFPNSYNVLLDRKGLHIVHPDSAMVLHQSFFAEAYGKENDAISQMRADMAAGRAGYVENTWKDCDYYVFYKNIKTAGWQMVSVCPANEVIVGVERYAIWASVLAIVFLVLVVAVCRMSVRYVLHPIENITIAMRRVAHGKYDNELVPYMRKDEIGRMRSAFAYMQKSLSLRDDKMRHEIWLQEKIDTDMRLADFMRQNILRMNEPLAADITSVSIDACTQHAKMMAGDMYQYLVSNGKLYFMLMGVSSRGTLASVIMSSMCRVFRAEFPRTDKPELIADLVNRMMSPGNTDCVFCPAFIGMLDFATGTLTYCNAGYLAPVLLTPSCAPSKLAVTPNLPIGAFADTKYEAQSVVLRKGSVLCLYSDGVLDACNADMDMYGEERLLNTLCENGENPPKEIIRNVFQNISSFIGSEEQRDDISLLVIRCEKTCNS